MKWQRGLSIRSETPLGFPPASGARIHPAKYSGPATPNTEPFWAGTGLRTRFPARIWLRAGRLGLFLYLYWLFFDFVSIRELFGMAERPRSRPMGVDSGPGEGGFGGGPGGSQTLYKYTFFCVLEVSLAGIIWVRF